METMIAWTCSEHHPKRCEATDLSQCLHERGNVILLAFTDEDTAEHDPDDIRAGQMQF